MPTLLTDDAVSRLPLSAARAELLEEIVASTSSGRTAVAAPARRSSRATRRWLVPAAAAAVVAALAGVSAVHHGLGGPQSTSAATDASDPGERVVVDAPGWQVDVPGADGGIYRDGQATLEITTAPASLYQEYVRDREDIVSPPAPGTPVQVLGVDGQMWAYTPDDHTVIREPVDGQWMELRGQGMDEATFRSVLASLRLVSVAQFEQLMPSRFITAAERPAAIAQVLDGIQSAIGSGHGVLPSGHSAVRSDAEDPSGLDSDVTGQVTCAWLDQYAAARADGDESAAADAVAVLATAPQWPVMRSLDHAGAYGQVVREYARQVQRGQIPQGYQSGLGCPS